MKSRAPRMLTTTLMALTLGAAEVLSLGSSIVYAQTGKEVSPGGAAPPRDSTATSAPRLAESFGKLPLSFEPNSGQAGGGAKFLSHGVGYTLLLTSDSAILELEESSTAKPPNPRLGALGSMKSSKNGTKTNGTATTQNILQMKLVDANVRAAVAGAEELAGKSNYFLGNDPTKWRTNIPNYSKVKYHNVYPGVDLVYYGTQGGQLEYDFVVEPGADPHVIGISLQGAERMRVDHETGDLVVALAGSELRFCKPIVYQLISQPDGRASRTGVDGTFVLTGKNQVGFQVGAYDRTAPLIIDPTLIYSTFLGGGQLSLGTRVAVDASGSAYVVGATNSSDFTATAGVLGTMLDPGTCSNQQGFFQKSYGINATKQFACPDAFVTKLNPAGTALVYSTYLGGSQADGATGISVDSSGNAYVTGITGSTDFPTTAGAFQTTASASKSHAFAAKLNSTGSALVYSTYLAGSLNDGSTISALDSSSNLYVAGSTNSPDFPTTPGAFQTSLAGAACIGLAQRNAQLINTPSPVPCPDGFIAKLNAAGSALVYSTYLGGSNNDGALGLAVDGAGNAYVTGVTLSTDFPTANATALQPSFGTFTCGTTRGSNPKSCFHAFVTELNSTGTALTYSTFLGGNGDDTGLAIAVDSAGAAYVTGGTNSTQFPTTQGAAQTAFGGGSCGNSTYPVECPDAFVVKVAPAGAGLDYSTYLGGNSYDFGTSIAVDPAGDAYVVGATGSLNFPTDADVAGFAGGTCSIGEISIFNSLFYYDTTPGSVGYGRATSQGTNTYPGFSFNCPNAFLTEINPAGATRLFSTYLGGANGDMVFGVALDPSGGIYIAGSTLSFDFPVTTGSFQTSLTGYADAFVTKYFGLVTLSPSPVTFGPQQVGTASASQAITLTNMNASPLVITGIVASANFGETDDCGGSVAAGGSCTINVTFQPTVTGSLTGTLTVTDNSNGMAGIMQSVDLSGLGTLALVSIAVMPANPSIPLGGTQRFTATGTYTDASTLDLTNWATWGSSATGVATISNTPGSNGLATTAGLGTATITSAYGAITGSTTLTVTPGFILTGSLNVARYRQTATLLNNGLVLLVGGFNTSSAQLASAELYNPATDTFTLTGSLNTARELHTATLLNNGVVLIAGGYGSAGYISTAELYNPATGTFTPTGSLNSARYFHTATLLNNGMVLIAGGYGSSGYLASAELYNPATGTFTLTGSLNTARYEHTATLLDNGMVLIAGGYNGSSLASAELYNPATGTFSYTAGSLNTARYEHTATLLNNGMVLIAGGLGSRGYLASAELYNPATGTFSYTAGSLNTTRYDHTATLLNNGMVLIAGGFGGNSNPYGYLQSAELYNPATGTFTLAGSLNTARWADTATLLNNGMVLIAGGLNSTNGSLDSAELYEPGTLTPPNLVSISLSPSQPRVALNTALRFTATGTFSDGSTQTLASATWSSSNSSVVSMTNDITNSGTAYAVASGYATVSACAGAVCGTTTLASIIPAVTQPGPPVVAPPPTTPQPFPQPPASTPEPPASSGRPASPAGVGPGRPVHSPMVAVAPLPAPTTVSVAPAVKFSSSALVFPAQPVSAGSSAQTVTLTNPGDAPMPIFSITASGDFTQTNDCGTTLEPGAHCTISVTFKPGTAGVKSGTLSISENPDAKPQTVTLSGTASGAP